MNNFEDFEQFLQQYLQQADNQQQNQQQEEEAPNQQNEQQANFLTPELTQELLIQEAYGHPSFTSGFAEFMASYGGDQFVRRFINEITERAFEMFFPDYLRFRGLPNFPIKSAKYYFEQARQELLTKMSATGILDSVDPELAKAVRPQQKKEQKPYTNYDYYRDYVKMMIKTTLDDRVVDYVVPQGEAGFPRQDRLHGKASIKDINTHTREGRSKLLADI